jgi:propanol-preferring alcohol dehydrogenase
MRALQLLEWKHDPVLQDVDTPAPASGEVLVKVGGAGACHSDLHLMRDFDEGMVPFNPPFTLGHENAGWVAELGQGVSGLEVGQPVAVYGPTGCGHCRRSSSAWRTTASAHPPTGDGHRVGPGRGHGPVPHRARRPSPGA